MSSRVAAGVAALALWASGCGGEAEIEPVAEDVPTAAPLSGAVAMGASASAAPLAEVAADLFTERNPEVEVGVAEGSGGFEALCAGDLDLYAAGSAIGSQQPAACPDGRRLESFAVANEAIAVLVNADNDWADCMTIDQLSLIWDEGSNVQTWSDIDPEWPDEPIQLHGPGPRTGAFELFTAAINGEQGTQRGDYARLSPSGPGRGLEAVAADRGAMAYVSAAALSADVEGLEPIAVENPRTGRCAEPSEEAVQDGSYRPLARELSLHVTEQGLAREEVRALIAFHLRNADAIAERPEGVATPDWAGYVGLSDEQAEAARAASERLLDGSGAGGGDAP